MGTGVYLGSVPLQIKLRLENSASQVWRLLGLGLASVDSSLNLRGHQTQQLELVFPKMQSSFNPNISNIKLQVKTYSASKSLSILLITSH